MYTNFKKVVWKGKNLTGQKLFKENSLNFNSQIQTYEKSLQNISKLWSHKKIKHVSTNCKT